MTGIFISKRLLLNDCSNSARTNSTSAFTNREAGSFFDRDWGDQLNGYSDVVAWHNHFSTFRQVDDTCYVSCTEVKLGTVACEERFMTSTLFFSQNVDLSGKVSVRLNGTWLGKNLAALDIFAVYTAKKAPMLSPA